MNKKLKYGDARKDGYRFGGSSTVTNKSGEKKKIEKWYSPTSFLKLVKASRTATNRLRRDDPEKYRKQARDYKEANKDKYRSGRLKREFGISIEDYNKKLKRQGMDVPFVRRNVPLGTIYLWITAILVALSVVSYATSAIWALDSSRMTLSYL